MHHSVRLIHGTYLDAWFSSQLGLWWFFICGVRIATGIMDASTAESSIQPHAGNHCPVTTVNNSPLISRSPAGWSVYKTHTSHQRYAPASLGRLSDARRDTKLSLQVNAKRPVKMRRPLWGCQDVIAVQLALRHRVGGFVARCRATDRFFYLCVSATSRPLRVVKVPLAHLKLPVVFFGIEEDGFHHPACCKHRVIRIIRRTGVIKARSGPPAARR